MWGNTQPIVFTTGSFGAAPDSVNQLVKISYKRPDTWHWFFVAKLIAGPTPLSPQIAGIRVAFDLTIGVGRAVAQVQTFEEFVWIWGDPGGGVSPLPPLNQAKYSSSVWGPQRQTQNLPSPGFPALPTNPNAIEEIVAQDLQLQVRLLSESNFPNTIQLEVSAFFAPKTHMRPDWFQPRQPPEVIFGGAETGGK
jgi:hypothetical protein